MKKYHSSVVRKFFDRKYFIDKKFKIKYFCGYMTNSKYFYLEHITSDNSRLLTNYNEAIDSGKLLILTATTL